MGDFRASEGRAAGLRAAFPWTDSLSRRELVEFAAELYGLDTAGWSAAAVQHHAAPVTAYWKDRAAQPG